MTISPQEAYKKLLLKVNKNDTNQNVKVSKGEFVLLFNEQKRKYLDNILAEYQDSDYIETLSDILVVDAKLNKLFEDERKAIFELPSDYYDKASSYSIASKGDCKNQVIINWHIKPKNKNLFTPNENINPSFEYRETIALLSKDGLVVFKDNFTVDEVYLSYYYEPKDLDMAGYTKVDGTPSADVQTELSDGDVEYILDRTTSEILRNYQNTEGLQFALNRQTADFNKQ